jgi:hypothetical protein
MKGTYGKLYGKSGRSGAVLTLAGIFIMALALTIGLAGCPGANIVITGNTVEINPIASLVLGALLSALLSAPVAVLVAKHVIHRPRLTISLQLEKRSIGTDVVRGLGSEFENQSVDNLRVWELTLSLKGMSDITENMLLKGNEPALIFPGFKVRKTITVKKNAALFKGDIDKDNDSKLILNIKWFKAGSKAEFQIIGSFDKSGDGVNAYKAELYPGAIHNVDVKAGSHVVLLNIDKESARSLDETDAQLVDFEFYKWNDKIYTVKQFKGSDGKVFVQAFLEGTPCSSRFAVSPDDQIVQKGTPIEEVIDDLFEFAKGDVRNGIHERHNTR